MAELWFCLLWFMLATYIVLGGCDIGVGIIQFFVARGTAERSSVIDTIRPSWKYNEVWLVAAGGTMFLAFPKLLGVAFSGLYLPLMIVLWLICFRNLGIELRNQLEDRTWRDFWDGALTLSSLVLAICLGAALGTIIRGVPLDESGVFFEPLWTDFRVGSTTGVLDWYTLIIGTTAVVALAHHGARWLVLYGPESAKARSRSIGFALWLLLIGLWIVGNIASVAVQPLIVENLKSHPWGILFPLTVIAAFAAIWFFQRRSQPLQTMIASAFAIYAMIGSAIFGVMPYALPGREIEYSLAVKDTAAPANSLSWGLAWWIPGMLIVVGYWVMIYRLNHAAATSTQINHESTSV